MADYKDILFAITGMKVARDATKDVDFHKAQLRAILGGTKLEWEVNSAPTQSEVRSAVMSWRDMWRGLVLQDGEHAGKEMRLGSGMLDMYGSTLDFAIYKLLWDMPISDRAQNKIEKNERFCEILASIMPNFKPGMKMSRVLNTLLNMHPWLPKDHVIFRNNVVTCADAIMLSISEMYTSLKSKRVKMVISTDPADFLTMSENMNDWSSCHALNNCYAGGAVSYMMDDTSAIAFVYDGKDREFERSYGTFTHNSKAWRMMCHIDLKKRGFLVSRHYPNYSDVYERLIADKLKELLGITDTAVVYQNDCCRDGTMARHWYTEPNCEENSPHYHDMYNDYGKGYIADKAMDAIVVGTDGHICLDCGERFYPNEDGDDGINLIVCRKCYERQFSHCEACGDSHPKSNLTYHSGFKGAICQRCSDEANQCEVCGTWHTDRAEITVTNDGVERVLCVCRRCWREHRSRNTLQNLNTVQLRPEEALALATSEPSHHVRFPIEWIPINVVGTFRNTADDSAGEF